MNCIHYRCKEPATRHYCPTHASDRRCLVCRKRKQFRRGACEQCYLHARLEIHNGVTDAQLVERGALLPRYKSKVRNVVKARLRASEATP